MVARRPTATRSKATAARASASPANEPSRSTLKRCGDNDAEIKPSIVTTPTTGVSGSTWCTALVTPEIALVGSALVRTARLMPNERQASEGGNVSWLNGQYSVSTGRV